MRISPALLNYQNQNALRRLRSSTVDFSTGPGSGTHPGKLPNGLTQFELVMDNATITWYGSPGPGKTGTGPGQNAGLPVGQLTGFTISLGADATPKQRGQYLKIALAGVEHLDSGGTAGWGMDSLVRMTGR